MQTHYVMTDWGPMKAIHRKDIGNISGIVKGAPEDMDTFAEVYSKYVELENKIKDLSSGSLGSNTTVEELPEPSSDTLLSVYVDDSKNCFITINTGTEESPQYEWIPLNTPKDSMSDLTEDEVKDLFSDSVDSSDF